MDRHTELSIRGTAGSPRGRNGAAMASALFAIAVAAILTAGIHWMTRADIRATSNREASVRAMAIAEAGLAHALALVKDSLGDTTMTRLLRGWDGNKLTTDDNGFLVGYNLPTATQIPSTGRTMTGGTYFVRLVDDPAEKDNDPLTDRNTRVVAVCRGETTDGASATINAIVGNASLAGVSVNGDFTISGTTRILGRCGGVHTNGNLNVGTPLTVETRASATGTVSGTIRNTYSEILPPEASAAPVDFPALSAAVECSRADYRLRANGTALIIATNTVVLPAVLGWVVSGTLWEALSTVTSGTYCVEGNVKISQNIGAAGSPRPLSLIVMGSLEISGSPFLRSEDPNGILFILDGDLKLNGNSNLTNVDFSGFIYAGAQCMLSGQVYIEGQLVCRNTANPAGATEFAAQNIISGTTRIEYGCRGFLSQLWRVLAWYPTPGA